MSVLQRSRKKGTRLSTGGFNFKTDCFLCGSTITEKEKLASKHCYIAYNHQVDNAIDLCRRGGMVKGVDHISTIV